MKTIECSKRVFQIVYTCGKNNQIAERISWFLKDLLDEKNDYELAYALQEVIDSVLDLTVDEAMYFIPNRDNETSKGIIVRVK